MRALDDRFGPPGKRRYTSIICSYSDIEAIRMAHDLMDQVMRSKAVKDGKNKSKWDDNMNNSRQHNKRQEVVRDFTVKTSKRRGYVRTAPLCN
nr:hypothetical protein [Tanacetum cinerariifolium]